jgi:hypothetical protein
MNTSQTSSTMPYDGDHIGVVRTVAVAIDQYSGLKGHDYIKARNLNPPVQRVQTSAHSGKVACK